MSGFLFTLEARPAYGRSYSNVQECISDWDAGKDFKIIDGPYFSVRDLDTMLKDRIIELVVYFNWPRTNPSLVLDLEIEKNRQADRKAQKDQKAG